MYKHYQLLFRGNYHSFITPRSRTWSVSWLEAHPISLRPQIHKKPRTITWAQAHHKHASFSSHVTPLSDLARVCVDNPLLAELVYCRWAESFLRLTWDVHFCSWTVDGCTTWQPRASQTLHAHCADTGTNPLVFISHTIVPRHRIDSEITSKRCNHIWLCNRSLDGDNLQLQNGGRPSDVAQSYTSSAISDMLTLLA